MPRIKTKTVYTLSELKEHDHIAYERALDFMRQGIELDHVLSEMIDSLKGFAESIGSKLSDWSIGAYSQNNKVRIDLNSDWHELSGSRALAWLENNCLAQFRIPSVSYSAKSQGAKLRRELAKYGNGYRAGCVKPCPFTGMCYDESIIAHLKNEFKNGENVKEAIRGLSDLFGNMADSEYEYATSEECLIDNSDGYEFDEHGNIA